MKKILPFLIVFISGCSGDYYRHFHLPNKPFPTDKMPVPAGTVCIGKNLFIDEAEVSNFSYNEFVWWVKYTYGAESEEYKKVCPDQTVWADLGRSYFSLIAYYLTHPAYRDYPAVGVSYDQAKLFCKWRSDRVMEYILISEGVIDHRSSPTPDSCFTIERYFIGQYPLKKARPHIIYYPEYTLPDSTVYMWSLNHLDSLNGKPPRRCYKKNRCRETLTLRCYDNIPFKNDTIPYGPDPTAATICYGCPPYITHLQGNIREMTSQAGITFGGSFKDSCAVIKRQNFFNDTSINCFTGFRCVCRYKTWPVLH